jgi:hypothetical protein
VDFELVVVEVVKRNWSSLDVPKDRGQQTKLESAQHVDSPSNSKSHKVPINNNLQRFSIPSNNLRFE